MSDYKYGAYGHVKESVIQSAAQASTVLVYVGTAPVNLVRGYREAGIVHRPVKAANLLEAQRKVGYSEDWASFSLCEAAAMHFNHPQGSIGPVYFINVLDPQVHQKEEETTAALQFSNGRAAILSDTIILDTLVLDGKMEGTDFTVDYDFNRKMAVISLLGEDSAATKEVQATYSQVDPAKVTQADIIGGVTANGEYTGLGSLQLLYQEHNAVVNLLAAPGWSHIPAVYRAMCSAVRQVNGHWDAYVLADIPLADGEGQALDTIAKAKQWKKDNGYSDERSTVCWPMGETGAGKAVHLSTLGAVELLRADESHGGVPMETAGNKPIPIVKQYFGKASANKGFDQQQANQLTAAGISTAVFWGGRWVLWGDHTAA